MYKLIFLAGIALICTINGIVREDILDLSCLSTVDCFQFEHNATKAVVCSKGNCVCKDANFTRIECKPKYDIFNNIIGGHCPCTMPNSECNNNEDTCYCATDYVPSEDKRRCLPKSVPLNDSCEFDAQCSATDNFGQCSHYTKECACERDFIFYQEGCTEVLNSSYHCDNDDQCDRFGPYVKCSRADKACVCNYGFVRAQSKDMCMKGAYYHDLCTYNVQCQWSMGPGAICKNGICECKSKSYLPLKMKYDYEDPYTWKCSPYKVLGQYCRYDEDCQYDPIAIMQPRLETGMICAFAECNCRDGWSSHNNLNCTKNSANNKHSNNGLLTVKIIALTMIFFLMEI